MSNSRIGKFVWLCTLALGGALLGGCGSRFADYCDAQAQCVGGNDADIDACKAQGDGSEEVAAAYDCSDAFDKLADCIDKTGNCEDNTYTSNCGDESEALAKCEESASAHH